MTTHLRVPRLLLAAAVALALTAAALALPRESAHAEGTASIVGTIAQDASDVGSHDAMVRLYREDPDAPGAWEYLGWDLADETHTYGFTSLDAGTYKVYYDLRYSQIEGWWENGSDISTATPVAVAAGQTVTLDPVGMKAYPTISGQVTASATGLPVEDVALQPAYKSGTEWDIDFEHGALTKADGTYTIHLPSGKIRLKFGAEKSTGLAQKYWPNAPNLSSATTISVAPGDAVTGIDIALDPAPTSITNTVRPTIVGTAKVGAELYGEEGEWYPETIMFVDHQWKRNGVPILGADDLTYTITTADVGKRLTNTVTMTHQSLGTASATSAPTAVVPALAFKLTSSAALLGKLKVGKVVRAVAPRSTPTAAVSFQWLRNGRAIGGAAAKKASYKLVRADRRKRIGVRITLRRLGYTTVVRAVVRPAKVR